MPSQELEQKIAENLRLYRTLHGFTQAQLAECLSYSDKSVSKWERGEATPDVGILYTLSEIYGVTVSELIGQTEKSKETHQKESDGTGEETKEEEIAKRKGSRNAALL